MLLLFSFSFLWLLLLLLSKLSFLLLSLFLLLLMLLELVDLLDQKGGEHADQDLLLLLGLSESVVEGVKVRRGQQSDKLQAWT